MKPVILCIIDGFGINPIYEYNAIKKANTPCIDYLLDNYPHSKLETSGKSIGLPDGQFGNSEVGHMTIGSGRVIEQDLVRINNAIKNSELLDNKILNDFISKIKPNSNCHIIGLFSTGGVHSHQDHIIYISKYLSKNNINISLHLFTDGRDTTKLDVKNNISIIEDLLGDNNIKLCTVSGRYYSMDRDNRWDRIEKSYRSIFLGEGIKYDNINKLIEYNYSNNITDEFILPSVINGYKGVNEDDSVIIMNFRADRLIQILSAIVDKDFDKFDRKYKSIDNIIGMVEYSELLSKYIKPIFNQIKLDNILPSILANNDLRQYRIAETEKYAHVTFFFNGGIDEKYNKEERILIDSKKVETYDLYPSMSAIEITDNIISLIDQNKFDFLLVNYANCDMVGHTGKLDKTIEAVEIIDKSLSRIIENIKDKDIILIITADHGNAEEMFDYKNNIEHTAHTMNPVPFIIVNHDKDFDLEDGNLSDIAPTVLDIMNIEIPNQMTGKSLIKYRNYDR